MRKTIDMMTIEELEEKIKKYNNLTFVVKVDEKELLEEYKKLKEKLKDKNAKIQYLNEVIDGLEEEIEELEDECCELEDENYRKKMKKYIDTEIIKACQINMKDCLDAIELMNRIEKR